MDEGHRSIQNSPKGQTNQFLSEPGVYDMGGSDFAVKKIARYYKSNETFRSFLDSLTGNEKVVDLGAGLGSSFVRFIRKKGKLNNLVSIDLDLRNLRFQQKKNRPNNFLVQADASVIPLKTKSADIVVECFMREDNKETRSKSYEIDLEIERVLKPGGLLILDGPNTYLDEQNFKLLFNIDGLRIYRFEN